MNRFATSAMMAVTLLWAGAVHAGARWIAGFESARPSAVVADPSRDRAYLLDGARGELVIVDTATERIQRVSLGQPVEDLALSKDGRTLATVAAHDVITYDLKTTQRRTIAVKPAPQWPERETLVSVTWDTHGYLYVGAAELKQWGHLHRVDPTNAVPQLVFGPGGGGDSVNHPLVRTDARGLNLWVLERGVVPGTVSRFDVSGVQPVFRNESQHGDLDFLCDILSIDGSTVHVGAYGSLNHLTSEILPDGALALEAAMPALALARRGQQVVFSTLKKLKIVQDMKPVAEIPLEAGEFTPAPLGLAVERSGRKALVVMGRARLDTGNMLSLEVDPPFKLMSVDLPAAR